MIYKATAMLRKMAAVAHPRFFFQRIMEQGREIGPYCVLSFDCDFPRDIAVLPQLVEVLDRYDVKASFACIGQWVRAYPAEHGCLVEAGHELLNHTQTHPNLYHPGYDYARTADLSKQYFNRIGRDARREEIERCHATFSEILGVVPTGFRTPHFGALHVDDVYPILAELGYRFSSSLTAGRLGVKPFRVEDRLWEVPLSPCPLHPFGVFDSWHSLAKTNASHAGEGELAGLFSQLVDFVSSQGGLANVYFDPCDMLGSGEMERVLELLVESGLPVITYGELVDILEREELGFPVVDCSKTEQCNFVD